MEHEQIITLLVTVLLMLLSVLLGKYIGERGKVKCSACEEHRKNCQDILNLKIDNLIREIGQLTKVVNGKILGI